MEIVLLVHLRFLAIRGRMQTIPSSIDNLSNLETLLLEGHFVTVSLPNTLWNMKKLRHLCITGVLVCWDLPKENPKDASNLENLYTLSVLSISFGKGIEKLMRKFPNIRRLKCKLFTEEECTGDCKILALDFMSELESLTIFQDRRSIPWRLQFLPEAHNRSEDPRNILRFLMPDSLIIHEEQHVLPDLQFLFPLNLKKLVMSKLCLPWSTISAIAELPNLEVLKLLADAFTGETWEIEEGQFPKLRILKLLDLDLVRWTGSDDDFPSLEKLVLEKCPYLNEVPSSLGYISTLEVIEVSGCKAAANSIKQILEVQMDMGNEDLAFLYPRSEESFYMSEDEDEGEEEELETGSSSSEEEG